MIQLYPDSPMVQRIAREQRRARLWQMLKTIGMLIVSAAMGALAALSVAFMR